MVSNVKQGKYWINNNNNDADTVFRPLKFIYLERGVVTFFFLTFFPVVLKVVSRMEYFPDFWYQVFKF